MKRSISVKRRIVEAVRKGEIASDIFMVMRSRSLDESEVARRAGVDRSDVVKIAAADVSGLSVERLSEIKTRLFASFP